MTGARITTTLLNGLQFHDKEWGLETMCVGGGQGMAMIVQRLQLTRSEERRRAASCAAASATTSPAVRRVPRAQTVSSGPTAGTA